MDCYALGCFGKLPIHSDFIRHQAANIEVRALDQWFQEGIYFSKSLLGRNWAEAFSESDPWNFVFHSGTGFLVGVSIPSRDKIGRAYPFFLFLRVEKKDFGAPLRFAPLCFSLFLKEARKLATTGWQGRKLKTFLSKLGQIKVPPPKAFNTVHEDYLRFLHRLSIREFWTYLFGDFNDPKKYHLDRNLTDILQAMRAYPSRSCRLGLRVPLIPEKHLEEGEKGLDLPFWFDWVSLCSKQTEDPIFFWNREGTKHAPSLLAFFSPPSPKQFLALIQPETAHDTWVNLAPSSWGNAEKSGNLPHSQHSALLDDEALSMAAFLDETRKRLLCRT